MQTNYHHTLTNTLSECGVYMGETLIQSGIPSELLDINSKMWELEYQSTQSPELAMMGSLKHKIASCNIRRHELMEAIDSLILELYPPADLPVYPNSETPGQLVDKLGIMLLRQKNSACNAHKESLKLQYQFVASILNKMLTAIEQRAFTIIEQPQFRRHFGGPYP